MGRTYGMYMGWGDACRALVGKPEGRRPLHLEDGRIILKWIFKRLDGEAQTESIWLSTGTGGGLL
jgi:hypothetical protein